jgi:murein endopeptidase
MHRVDAASSKPRSGALVAGHAAHNHGVRAVATGLLIWPTLRTRGAREKEEAYGRVRFVDVNLAVL